MADNVLVPIVVAAIGLAAAVVTGVIGYRSARWNARKDLEIELRRQRLRALKQLWALSEPLGPHYRRASVTAASMRHLLAALQRWYFHEGGCFSPMSRGTPTSPSSGPFGTQQKPLRMTKCLMRRHSDGFGKWRAGFARLFERLSKDSRRCEPTSGAMSKLAIRCSVGCPLIIPMIIQTILLDPSGAIWIDGLPDVSRLNPSGAVQIDAEHPTRNRKLPA
jgi:hypothetical protein